MTDERSDDAEVEFRELRFEGGGGARVRDGGGGGAGFDTVGRTAYGTDIAGVDADGTLEGDEPGVGRLGSFGGSDGRRVNSAQPCITEDTLGLAMEDTETFSNDSSRLALSCSRPFSPSRSSRSLGNVATKFDTEPGVCKSTPPSEDRETE